MRRLLSIKMLTLFITLTLIFIIAFGTLWTYNSGYRKALEDYCEYHVPGYDKISERSMCVKGFLYYPIEFKKNKSPTWTPTLYYMDEIFVLGND